MVVLVPVALGAPAMLVFIPPLVAFTPATLPRLVQFAAFMLGLTTVASMFLDGLVEFVFGVDDSTLAAVDVLGMKPRRHREKQESS